MAVDISSRTRMEMAIQAQADMSVEAVMILGGDAYGMGSGDEVSPYANTMLREGGAHELFKQRLVGSSMQSCIDDPDFTVLFDVTVLPPQRAGYPAEDIALIAMFYAAKSKKPTHLGLKTRIGHRVAGSSLDVIALGVAPSLSGIANAIVCWRQALQEDMVAPVVDVPVRRGTTPLYTSSRPSSPRGDFTVQNHTYIMNVGKSVKKED